MESLYNSLYVQPGQRRQYPRYHLVVHDSISRSAREKDHYLEDKKGNL